MKVKVGLKAITEWVLRPAVLGRGGWGAGSGGTQQHGPEYLSKALSSAQQATVTTYRGGSDKLQVLRKHWYYPGSSKLLMWHRQVTEKWHTHVIDVSPSCQDLTGVCPVSIRLVTRDCQLALTLGLPWDRGPAHCLLRLLLPLLNLP